MEKFIVSLISENQLYGALGFGVTWDTYFANKPTISKDNPVMVEIDPEDVPAILGRLGYYQDSNNWYDNEGGH